MQIEVNKIICKEFSDGFRIEIDKGTFFKIYKTGKIERLAELYLKDNEGYYFLNNVTCSFKYDKNIEDCLFYLSFTHYIKSKSIISTKNEYKSCSINFEINRKSHLNFKEFENLEIFLNRNSLIFDVKYDKEGNPSHLKLALNLEKSKEIEKINLYYKEFYHFYYYLTGEFIKKTKETVYLDVNNKEFYEYGMPVYEDYVCMRFSRLSKQVNKETVEKGFPAFIDFYELNKYPLEIFLTTQNTCKIYIQQRISILLNSLEGLIRTSLDASYFKYPIQKKEKTLILSEVRSKLKQIISEKDFEEKVKTILNSYSEKQIKEIYCRISTALGFFTELSFDEILETSKTISKHGNKLVSKSGLRVKFWKRCKDHRNFFAHLTNSEFKGFDGTQSVFAMYILSSFFRLICLELVDLGDFFSETDILIEADSIKNWSKDVAMNNEIVEI